MAGVCVNDLSNAKTGANLQCWVRTGVLLFRLFLLHLQPIRCLDQGKSGGFQGEWGGVLGGVGEVVRAPLITTLSGQKFPMARSRHSYSKLVRLTLYSLSISCQ